MAIPYKEGKRLWDFIVDRYNIAEPVENKNQMFNDMISSYAKDFEGNEMEISRAGFVDRFFDLIDKGKDSPIKTSKNSLAKIAGFSNYKDFLEHGFDEDENEDDPGPTIDLSDLPEAIMKIFVTTGLTNAYPMRSDAKQDILADMSRAKESIYMYSRVYFSEIIKGTEFAPTIAKLALEGDSDDSPLIISHTSADPNDVELAEKQYNIEDPNQTRWKTLDEYVSHLSWSDSVFEERYRDTLQWLDLHSDKKPSHRRKLQFICSPLRNQLLPFSLMIIDNKIVYVSIYALSSNKYGTFAPTMRLVTEDRSETCWATKFLMEAKKIEKFYSPMKNRYPAI